MSNGFHQNADETCACQPYREWSSPWLNCPACARIAIRVVAVWIERNRQRRALLDLDDDQLRDVGISRAAAQKEAGKPFWL